MIPMLTMAVNSALEAASLSGESRWGWEKIRGMEVGIDEVLNSIGKLLHDWRIEEKKYSPHGR